MDNNEIWESICSIMLGDYSGMRSFTAEESEEYEKMLEEISEPTGINFYD